LYIINEGIKMTTFTNIRLDWLFDNFRNKKIIVLGDLMLDRYVWGTVNRISPEAPVPVVEVSNEFTRLGGAANVANNLYSLGATPIPIGIIGNDPEGHQLIDLMKNVNFPIDCIILDNSRPTVVKTRIIANDQHVVRADRESREIINSDILEKVINAVKTNISQVDALIIEDYNKGLLSKELIREVIDLAKQNQKIITVDPKFDNFSEYKSVTLFKPNRKETEAALGIKINSFEKLEQACRTIMDRLKCDAVLITLGDQGMCLLNSIGEFTRIPTKARKVHDVSGAGDTVISTLTLTLTTGADMKEAVTLANYAAGAVCGEVGVVPIEPSKLREAIDHFN
jgi:rfaE bifunctional protein kinase chain/domain